MSSGRNRSISLSTLVKVKVLPPPPEICLLQNGSHPRYQLKWRANAVTSAGVRAGHVAPAQPHVHASAGCGRLRHGGTRFVVSDLISGTHDPGPVGWVFDVAASDLLSSSTGG